MSQFMLLAGVPGSGKSTLALRLLAENPDALLLSSDAMVEERGRRDGLTYQEAWQKHAGDVARELPDLARAAFASGRPVIWDQTNLTAEDRAPRIALVPPGYTKVAYAFETRPELCLERIAVRAAETGKVIPAEVFEVQRARYRRPSWSEGFDRIVVIP